MVKENKVEDKVSNVVDMLDWKYTKIAKKFIEIRRTDPMGATQYVREVVTPDDFKILNKYIKLELQREGAYEPREGQ